MNADDIFSFRALYEAAFSCTKNVAWKENVTLWMSNVIENVQKLESEIRTGSYRVSPAHVFHVNDPKPRTISATAFRDRVVQRSICQNYLYDLLTKSFIYDNCACQKNKGVSFAIGRFETHLHRYFREYRTNMGWIVRLDVKKYFPSIPHAKLKESLEPVIRDGTVKRLVFQVIDEFVKLKPEDDLSFLDGGFGYRGIGLGSQLSQLLALHYLSPLDNYLKRTLRVKHYLRYMDDMIFVVRTKEEAAAIYDEVSNFIGTLGLKLNEKSTILRLDQPVQFLKILFSLSNTGKVRRRVVRKSMNREIRRLNSLCRQFKENRLSFAKILEHTNTWFGYARQRANNRQIRYVKKLLKRNFRDFTKIRLETRASCRASPL